MDAAKASVKKFMSKDGKHDTSIHERVAPAVQNETVNRTQHEEATTAVDREVHQDHYHTTEQPVHDREVLPEQHHHNLMPTEERSFEHDDSSKVKERLAAEAGNYKNTSQRVEGEHTSSVAPNVGGEHVHHHVYETVQPVVQKQTVEPHVVHTTKPIHEVHHNAAQHHTASALPAVSMDEFKNKGGSLLGREERRDRVDGCPPEQFHPHGERDSSHKTRDGVLGAGAGAAAGGAMASRRRGSSSSSSSSDEEKRRSKGRTAAGAATGAGLGAGAGTAAGSHQHPTPASYGNDMHTTDSAATHKKPSLMDKLNPKVDADGDGKPGFMK